MFGTKTQNEIKIFRSFFVNCKETDSQYNYSLLRHSLMLFSNRNFREFLKIVFNVGECYEKLIEIKIPLVL